jgi:hypothetical protein
VSRMRWGGSPGIGADRRGPAAGRRILGPAALVVGALALAGCSQVAAIAPVGGGRAAEVRFAVNDVLVAEGVDVLTAPVCETSAGGDIDCVGEAVGGADIVATAPAGDPAQLTVSVGPAQLYSGGVQDVLDRAARPAS